MLIEQKSYGNKRDFVPQPNMRNMPLQLLPVTVAKYEKTKV
jgi:hypothetical protein